MRFQGISDVKFLLAHHRYDHGASWEVNRIEKRKESEQEREWLIHRT